MASLSLERGASLVEFAFVIPFLTLLVLGVIDFGRAYYLSIEVQNAAYTGAFYGTQNNTDTTGMQNAALGDAQEAKNRSDITNMTATASYGCECSGTASATFCPSSLTNACANPVCNTASSPNVVQVVQVCTSATYHPLFPWKGLPTSFVLTGSSKLRAGL